MFTPVPAIGACIAPSGRTHLYGWPGPLAWYVAMRQCWADCDWVGHARHHGRCDPVGMFVSMHWAGALPVLIRDMPVLLAAKLGWSKTGERGGLNTLSQKAKCGIYELSRQVQDIRESLSARVCLKPRSSHEQSRMLGESHIVWISHETSAKFRGGNAPAPRSAACLSPARSECT